MKKLFVMLFAVLFLAACGGGGEDNEGTPAPGVSSEKHGVKFLDATIEYTPAVEGNEVANLVQNNAPISVPKGSIVKVIWNYQCGWYGSGGPAIVVDFNQSGPTIISQPAAGGVGLISLLDDQGSEYFINITEVDTSGSTVPVVVDEINGLITYGDSIPEACP